MEIIKKINDKIGWFFTNGNKSIHKEFVYSSEEDIKNVAEILGNARKFNVETEVVMWALKYMKKDPRLTITEAIILGHDEWVKSI